jgi:competence protein ComEC
MLIATAATSLIAGIATAPFAAYHFNRFSDYGVAANVLVMPVVSFVIMPAGVLALLVMPFGLEWLPLAVMEWGLERMLQAAHWVASWPGATQAIGSFSIEALSVIIAGGLWIALWQSAWRWLGAFAIVSGLLLSQRGASADIIIADDGSNVAVRDPSGTLRFLSSRRGRFDVEMWMRADGDPRDVADAMKAHDNTFDCDEAGCIAVIGSNPSNRLVVSRTPQSLADDCIRATVLIDFVRGTHPVCKSPQLTVTPQLLWRTGAIAVHLHGTKLTWTTVADERGLRPWSQPPPQHGTP